MNRLTDKIFEGIKLAERRLIEDKAARGESLVYGTPDGGIVYVPAKDLLGKCL